MGAISVALFIAGEARSSQLISRPLRERLEISELPLNGVPGDPVIDIEILVHEDVAKTSPGSQSSGEVGGYRSGLFESREGVLIALRSWEVFFGGEVIPQIEHAFHGQV